MATSSTTKTTTMTTPAKLYGKDLSEYDEVDVDALLAQLSPEEINILAKEVDPDDNFLPPNQRCSYECKKDPTGPLDRKKLIEHINKEALETPDLPEIEPFVKGTVRGKKWVPPPRDDRELAAEEQIAIDMGEEYEHALSDATQEEIIDLAAILGFHSMMNQDQYHASLLNKGQPIGMGWDGITKSTTQKLYPMDPPNTTDIEESVKRVKDDDPKLIELNLNNIKNISDEKYEQLFAALPQNEHLEVLSLTNVGLTDKTALLLAEAIEKSKTLRVLNVETNFISPPVIVTLVKSLLKARTIEEFRASNQRSTVLGNKIEMEITDLVEKNTSLLRLGLHLEFNDARHRVAAHLQRNIDRNEHELRKGNSLSKTPSPTSRRKNLLSMQKANSPKPVHLVLTPQERIDSKSDLIASLVSQKQDDRAIRGEISLEVPQNLGAIKKPVTEVAEKVSPIKTAEPPKQEEEKKPDIKNIEEVKAVSPNPSVDKKPIKEVEEKVTPVKTEEPSKLVEENKPVIKTVEEVKSISPKPNVEEKPSLKETKSPEKERSSPVKAKFPVEERISPVKAQSPVGETISSVKAKSNVKERISPVKARSPVKERISPTKTYKVPPTPYPSLEESLPKSPGEETVSPVKAQSPVKERISPVKAKSPAKETKPEAKIIKVPPTPYQSLDEPSTKSEKPAVEFSQIAEQNEGDVTPLFEKKISPTRKPKIGELRHSNISRAIDIDSPEALEIDTVQRPVELPEKLEKTAEPESAPSEPVTIDRDRLSESVSPSRHLEDKMTLLRAKIDSFAEVADEKMASLRSRIDDIAREPLSSVTDEVKPQKVRRPAQVIPPLESLTQISEPTEVVPTTLPPRRPLPLIKTPNSVGITLLYQQQIFEKPSITLGLKDKDVAKEVFPLSVLPKVERIAEKINPLPRIESVPEVTEVPELITEIVSTVPSSENPAASNLALKEEKTTPEVQKLIPSTPETAKELDKPVLEKVNEPISTVSAKAKTPEIQAPIESMLFETTNIDKISEKIEKPQEELKPVEVSKPPPEPIKPEPPKIDRRILTLSQLTVKKGETVNIDPIKTIEKETQSLPKASPLLRLSVKKADSQKIDPVKMTEASTQSIPKPNPMSLLSIKKGEIIAIDPIKKSEISTQFMFEIPQDEAASQTIEEEPIQTLEDTTQTPLIFSSLEHDYIFPGLRRVPYLPRPKSINIGGGDRVVVKPSSKPINEVLMLLYPVLHDHSRPETKSKTFGLEEDLIKAPDVDNTIKDLEETMQKATEVSKSILTAPPTLEKEPEKVKEEPQKIMEEVSESVRTEIEIPLAEGPKPSVAAEARFETKFTAVEKVSAISRTTIESEEHVKFIDKAYKSIAEVSTSERDRATTTSIKSANMWQSLSSNLIRASEQTLLDLSKAAEMGEGVSTSNRTKIGKVSVYSSIEDLSRSKFSDRHLGTLIKTVETTSVYSSMEDIPYTKYSDRYKDGKAVVSTASVYSSTEDLPQSSGGSKYSLDVSKPIAKSTVYSSMEDLTDTSYSKYSDRYSASHYTIDLPKPVEKPREKLSLLPRSKFSDRYKDDHSRSIDTHPPEKFPSSYDLSQASAMIDKSYYKSSTLADHSASRSHYKSTEELLQRSKITDRSAHESHKYQDSSLQTSIQSSISRNQSALRPYTYVPSTAHSHLSIDHVLNRPASPSTHTTTLQLNISPSGISELPSTSRVASRYSNRDIIDKPMIKISRVRDDPRSFRISPIEKRSSRPTKNLLSPYQYQVSDPTDDEDESLTIEESSQPTTLDTLSSSASTTTATDAIDPSPKKRINIMDTIKALKNRVRDVITTEDRFTESHRLPSSSSTNTSSSSNTRRGSRSTGVRSKIPRGNDEKEI
ncbi:titin isoform X5 [Episyrphus balteatus]|uniref:titin isoform X5 n=1 Tax=Episyrphus balteatus TaxID=286459 RepID=UPI00248516C2|nr:titin isoform X5 [Episyrphus balteatus]